MIIKSYFPVMAFIQAWAEKAIVGIMPYQKVFFGILKQELVFWEKYETRIQAKSSIIDYIEMFYNSKRRHSYLNYMTPMEFEKQYVLQEVA